MRRILGLAAVVVLGGLPAFAAADAMAGFYGNTVVVTGSDGFQARAHYRADHTMDISGTAAGKAFSTKGTWKIDAKGQLCRSYEKTLPTMPNPLCTPAMAHKVGDTWTATTATGVARNITLVAGVK